MVRHLAVSLLVASTAAIAAAQTELRALGKQVPFAAQEAAVEAPAWGIADESILNVNAFAFDTVDSGQTHSTVSGGGRYITGGSGQEEWRAGVSLPSGALVTGLEVQGCDFSSTGQLTVLLLRQTILAGAEELLGVGNPVTSGIAAMPGCVHLSQAFAIPATIANANQGYLLSVQQTPGVNNGDLRFTTVRIRYRLQVSPAPGSATFGDVPTGHPFFRFVEALVDAGITAGCGGGNYCVDNPISRGEMAVFLSVALGLHFPN